MQLSAFAGVRQNQYRGFPGQIFVCLWGAWASIMSMLGWPLVSVSGLGTGNADQCACRASRFLCRELVCRYSRSTDCF